jgi:hypothetical protein
MGVNTRNKIITDNLLMHLDAANRMSCNGIGTVWKNLCNNEYTTTLTNTLFSSKYNGGIRFSEDLDTHCLTTIPSFFLGNVFTISFFFERSQPGGFNSTGNRLITCDRVVNSTKWCLGMNISGNIQFAGSGGTDGQPSFFISSNTPYYVALTHNVNVYSLYLNNQKVLTNYASTMHPDSFGNVSIGCRPSATDREWNGIIYVASIYNRVLNNDEIIQNYNALKSRFGL